MRSIVVAMSGAVLALAGCAPIPDLRSINLLSNDFEGYVVVLAPNEDETMLEVLTAPQGWDAGGKNNGYVGFEQGKFGTITLTLDELPSNPECTADPATSANWVITSVRLSKNGNPNTQKGFNFGSNQAGWLTSAFPGADDDGVVWSGSIGNSKTWVILENLNNNNGAQMAYYEVIASKCDETAGPIPTDPGVGNGGRR